MGERIPAKGRLPGTGPTEGPGPDKTNCDPGAGAANTPSPKNHRVAKPGPAHQHKRGTPANPRANHPTEPVKHYGAATPEAHKAPSGPGQPISKVAASHRRNATTAGPTGLRIHRRIRRRNTPAGTSDHPTTGTPQKAKHAFNDPTTTPKPAPDACG